MKNCPSCDAELADYAAECIYCGHTFGKGDEPEDKADETEGTESPAEESTDAAADEGESGDADASADEPEVDVPAIGEDYLPPEMPQTKPCTFCGSEIAFQAMRCPHCAGFLPIAEGTIFGQYFFFLFASMAMVVGCLLPWERVQLTSGIGLPGYDLTGAESIGGAFLLIFALYGMIASVWNIYHRKMIVWPVILAAVDGAIIGWTRVVQITKDVQIEITALEEFGQVVQRVKGYIGAYGPGLYLVTIFSTLVLLSIVLSVFKGAKEDKRRKSEDREARAAARTKRRS